MKINLPPAIEIILSTKFPESGDKGAVFELFKRLYPELHRQSEWATSHFTYLTMDEHTPGEFVVCPTSSLDPFGKGQSCTRMACRLQFAHTFASTVGLYSDKIYIPDPLSHYFQNAGGLSLEHFNSLFEDVLILKVLEPLIRSGVIRFGQPGLAVCKTCMVPFVNQIHLIVEGLFKSFRSEIHFRGRGDFITTTTGKLHDPGLIMKINLTSSKMKRDARRMGLKRFVQKWHKERLINVVTNLTMNTSFAQENEGVIFSSSREELLALRQLEGRTSETTHIEQWEVNRGIRMPWISGLSVEGIIHLRAKASAAIPAFRSAMAGSVGTLGMESDVAIKTMRTEALQIEAELKKLLRPRDNSFRLMTGLAGITLAVYGFASGRLPATASLLSLLGMLTHQRGISVAQQKEVEALKARSGYVLLKARELLSHANSLE